MNIIMTHLPDFIHQVADECEATLVPYKLDSQLVFIGDSNRKRVPNDDLRKMSEKELRAMFHALANPPVIVIKSSPIVEWFRSQRAARSPITGHYLGGER